MELEEVAQVQERLAQSFAVHQEKGDQQSPDPAVSIEEGVDGLELSVCVLLGSAMGVGSLRGGSARSRQVCPSFLAPAHSGAKDHDSRRRRSYEGAIAADNQTIIW
jgi:hypothetical protein